MAELDNPISASRLNPANGSLTGSVVSLWIACTGSTAATGTTLAGLDDRRGGGAPRSDGESIEGGIKRSSVSDAVESGTTRPVERPRLRVAGLLAGGSGALVPNNVPGRCVYERSSTVTNGWCCCPGRGGMPIPRISGNVDGAWSGSLRSAGSHVGVAGHSGGCLSMGRDAGSDHVETGSGSPEGSGRTFGTPRFSITGLRPGSGAPYELCSLACGLTLLPEERCEACPRRAPLRFQAT